MSTARRVHYTYDEYLSVLEQSNVRLEYCDGEIYAMAGGTPTHARLAASMTRLLGNCLLNEWGVFSSDLKLRIEATGLATFPDVTVVCGEPRAASDDKNALTNPSLLVEVTSKSTEDYDRGEKLSHYRQCLSLRAVLFVSHSRPQVTVIERAATGWMQREFRSGDVVSVAEPLVTFTVDQLYAASRSRQPERANARWVDSQCGRKTSWADRKPPSAPRT